MAFNYEFPYVDPHRYNADWVLQYVKDAKEFLERYKKAINDLGLRDDELEKRIADMESWIANSDRNIMDAVKRWIATMILVEISDEGYIVYHIPDSWHDITFNTTGLDIEEPLQTNYGYLVLSY